MQVERKSSISAVAVIRRASAGLSDGMWRRRKPERAGRGRDYKQTIMAPTRLSWVGHALAIPPSCYPVHRVAPPLFLERGMRTAKE
jgi:hypothetical protein